MRQRLCDALHERSLAVAAELKGSPSTHQNALLMDREMSTDAAYAALMVYAAELTDDEPFQGFLLDSLMGD